MEDQDGTSEDQAGSDLENQSGDEQDASQDNSEDKVLVDKKYLSSLQSQKDKNEHKSESLAEELDDLKQTYERDKAIAKFLKENAEDYPDVEAEDLEGATTTKEIAKLATKAQEKYSQIEQRALAKLQNVPTPPALSQDEKKRKVQELSKRAQDGEDVFEEWLELTEQANL